MRKLWLVLGLLPLLALSALPAKAQQNVPRVEVFAGYAYGSINAGPEISNDQRQSLPRGWNAQIIANANRWFGVAFDYTGYSDDPTIAGGRVSQRIHILTAGPRVTARIGDRFTPYAHVLLGMMKAKAFVVDPTTGNSDSAEHTNFALLAGGGVDAKISRHFAVRLAEFDLIHSRLPQNRFDENFAIVGQIGHSQNSFKVSTGVIIRFGGDR